MSRAPEQLTQTHLVAPIGQTKAITRVAIIDLLGGGKWAAILITLLIATPIVDLVLLPLVLKIKNAEWGFLDFCAQMAGGPSGGFALPFLLLIAITLYGLHLLMPRSLGASWVFLAVMLALQWFVSSKGGIQSFAETYLGDIVYFVLVDCGPDGRGSLWLQEYLQNRYNPHVFPDPLQPPGGNAGVPREFTNMLGTNVALLAIMSALIWVCVVFRWLWRAIGSFFGRVSAIPPSETDKVKYWFNMRGGERAIVFQSAIMTMIFAMLGPALLLGLSSNPGATGKALENLFWIGPLVFLLDLARVAVQSELDSLKTSVTPAPEVRTKELVLPNVVQNLEKTLPQEHQLHFIVDPLSATETDNEMLKAPQKMSIPKMVPGDVRLLSRTFTDDYYRALVEVFSRDLIERGKTVLVLCPVESLEAVKNGIATELDKPPFNLHANMWFSDPNEFSKHTTDTKAVTHIFLSTAEGLEDLLRLQKKYENEISRLGGIVLINLHRMDLGLLHLSLARLNAFVARREDVIAVAQSEVRTELSNWVGNLPIVSGQSVKPVQSMDRNDLVTSHTMLLKNGPYEAFNDRTKWPAGHRALIAARKLEPDCAPYFFDSENRFSDEVFSENIFETLRQLKEAPNLLEWAEHPPRRVMAPIHAEHPVALIENHGNFADALAIRIASGEALETLKIIQRGISPGNIFLMDQFLESWEENAKTVRERLSRFMSDYGSVNPRPTGGPFELALKIVQEMRVAPKLNPDEPDKLGGLSQQRIKEIWGDDVNVLSQLRISNTQSGLQRLFRTALNAEANQQTIKKAQARDRSWHFALTDSTVATWAELATLRVIAGTPRSEVLPYADLGLSYAEGTRLALSGTIYQVRRVAVGERSLFLDRDDGNPLRPYVFQRAYAFLKPGGACPDFAIESLSLVEETKVNFEMVAGYLPVARKTLSYLEYGGLRSPLDSAAFTRQRTDIDFPMALRSFSILNIARPETGLDGTSRDFAGRLAFTLATTLQDVLALLFPPNAHRLAVVCPQAKIHLDPNTPDFDNITNFVLLRQPWLHVLDQNGQTVETTRHANPLGLNGQALKEYEKAIEQIFSRNAPQEAQNAAPDGQKKAPRKRLLASLMLIEDSDHDLGVAKAINDVEVRRKVFSIWGKLLDHSAATRTAPERAAYAFNSDTIATKCFEFEAAARIVAGMASERGQL